MLHEKDAFKVEMVPYGQIGKDGKRRTYKLYFFKCKCGAEIGSQFNHLKKHSGKCVSCAQFNDPFRAAYNELIRSCERRSIIIEISYEDFLEYTKIERCHYCHDKIFWYPHTKLNGKEVRGSRSYKLDRKDNIVGYLKNNCAVCCKRCNEGKSNSFSYEEWYGMTEYLRNLRKENL